MTKRNDKPEEPQPAPSPNGRDGRGRFSKGNPGGPGNPLGGKVARLRSELVASVTPWDVKAIMRRLVKMAKVGDLGAARLVLSYTLGEPIQADVIERLESLEAVARSIQGETDAGLDE